MARLIDLASKRGWPLLDLSSIGRHASQWIVFSNPQVSSHHAHITWRAGRWLLTDGGSTNGTRLDGVPVGAVPVELHVNQIIQLGGSKGEALRVERTDPPEPIGRLDDGTLKAGEDGVLVLGEGIEALTVTQGPNGGWEVEGQPVPADGRVVSAGRPWQLYLPELVEVTAEAPAPGSALIIRYSGDLEDFSLAIRAPDGAERALGARTYAYMLYLLALRYRDDRAEGVADAEAGWVDVEGLLGEIAQAEGRDPGRHGLNLHVLRFRRLMSKSGLDADDGPRIERRGQLRLRLVGPVSLEPMG
ncbi:MAG: FHA domain-containing protein [bacterium]